MTRTCPIASIAAAALALVLAVPVARSQVPPPAGATAASGTIVIEAGGGRVVRISGKIASLFVADPKVVEVRPASPGSVFVFGVGAGRSTVAALDEAGNPLSQFDVVVQASSYAAGETAGSLRRAAPGARVQLTDTPEGMIVHGRVPDPAAAEQLEFDGKELSRSRPGAGGPRERQLRRAGDPAGADRRNRPHHYPPVRHQLDRPGQFRPLGTGRCHHRHAQPDAEPAEHLRRQLHQRRHLDQHRAGFAGAGPAYHHARRAEPDRAQR